MTTLTILDSQDDTMITWPRLTETLPVRSATACNCCGQTLPGPHDLHVWQEHDDDDRPESRYIVLCIACSDRIIDPHPRLYRQIAGNEPCPGAMAQCVGCKYLDGLRCRHQQMLVNGGPGVAFAGPDSWVHLQMAGPGGRGRRGGIHGVWYEVPTCPVREPLIAAPEFLAICEEVLRITEIPRVSEAAAALDRIEPALRAIIAKARGEMA